MQVLLLFIGITRQVQEQIELIILIQKCVVASKGRPYIKMTTILVYMTRKIFKKKVEISYELGQKSAIQRRNQCATL